jgi:cell wall-associated NlpC family hydrolase
MPLTREQRDNVVRAAKAWIGTPYHHKAAVKKAGADCAMFPVAVYKECGIIPADYHPPEYSTQWHLHRSDELYLKEIEKFAILQHPEAGSALQSRAERGIATVLNVPDVEMDSCVLPQDLCSDSAPSLRSGLQRVQPADFIVFQFGRTFSHGAIVVEWPLIIHAYIPHGVTLADAVTDGQLIGREYKVYEISTADSKTV